MCMSQEFLKFRLPFIFLTVLFYILMIFYSPSYHFIDKSIEQLDLYYNLSSIMNINSNDCNEQSNNILGYFGGIPEGRTYTKKPKKYCPYNINNFIVGKCKENPKYDYDICDKIKYKKDDEIITYFNKDYCVTINEIKMKYYNYFKGIRLCSISQNKFNYYTLLKNSTKTINECLKQKNMKICGILDDLNQIVFYMKIILVLLMILLLMKIKHIQLI